MTTEVLSIESLDIEARGIARRDGKTVFVEGALPGEVVQAELLRQKSSYDIARTVQVLRPSAVRVTPRCPHFDTCGGCAMQHLDPVAQVAIKQRVLEDNFARIAKVSIPHILSPIQGPAWHYRYRARLSVRYLDSLGRMIIGFHERKSRYVADNHTCPILPQAVSDLLVPLRDFLRTLSNFDRIPQIEVAMGKQIVLVIRHLKPFTNADTKRLHQFAAQHRISWWLQPQGPTSVHPLIPREADDLAYELPQFGLRMPYRPTDFTQVNHQMNQVLVGRALSLLAIQPTDRVADLFCGLGNFTLPMATQARTVVGIEGSAALTERARQAAQLQGLTAKTEFSTLNLFEIDEQWLRGLGYFDRILLDPPRDGAVALARALAALNPHERPQRIVYVSCNPSTLARDTAILVHVGGYHLRSAGVMNMFPHTAHVESIAVFDKGVAPAPLPLVHGESSTAS